MTTATLIAGFLASTVGFSFFLYGKKQARVPQLVVGTGLMVCPFLVSSAAWIAGASAALLASLWLALRAGW